MAVFVIQPLQGLVSCVSCAPGAATSQRASPRSAPRPIKLLQALGLFFAAFIHTTRPSLGCKIRSQPPRGPLAHSMMVPLS